MAKDKMLEDLFLDQLKDIYYAEKQIVRALPKMAKAAQDPKLKAGFEKHHGETQVHIERLEQVFEIIGQTPKGKTCDAILGILDEGKSVMEDYKDAIALDAGLIAAAQAVEHYEMARYGTLRTWAQQMGHADAAKLFETTLLEERATDQALTKLAESGGDNAKAA